MLTAPLGYRRSLPQLRSRLRHPPTRCASDGPNTAPSPMPRPGKKPSLIEQLFPAETKRYEAERARPTREIPRLPLDPSSTLMPVQRPSERRIRQALDSTGPQTSVLVLRRASKNLTLDDFRRLIPKGKHIDGWTLERGDIINVIPGRNLATLEQQNYYYLLFSSALSAFAYQGHLFRIHEIAASYTPSSLLGPLPPPPGFLADGMDVHDAVSAYTLTCPTQALRLRQLKPPLSPLLQSIVQHNGHASLNRRANKMPHELRLTLEGLQLPLSRIRNILSESGRDRALSWLGTSAPSTNSLPVLTRWDPQRSPSLQDRSSWAAKVVNERAENELLQQDVAKLHRTGWSPDNNLKRRTPGVVYIVGFGEEGAAQTFRAFWHGRAMEWRKGRADVRDAMSGVEQVEDAAPVARVEMLW